MKLVRLELQAFGPFTGTSIEFASHGANLHLIYGPNEAGKSCALRAMSDLRFGIPARSPDDFVHPYDRLRIAGVFLDRQGEAVGYARRKGRSPTLSRFDPALGAKDALLPGTAADEQALTGGLDRGAFESMFGLDHARLREGGNLLLKGEGELGAALFEASAGTRGIAMLRETLDADAKKLFNPHGRSTTATINEARRTLDEARQTLKHALTRPADWQTLHRAHEAALAKLTEATMALEALRRRHSELAELRTVAPLMREYDRVRVEMAELAGTPALSPTAREERLAAQQSLSREENAAREAALEIDQLTRAIDAMTLETTLLTHAETIDRLVNAVELGARSRLEAEKAKGLAADIERELALLAARLTPGGDSQVILAAVPSSADGIALNGHLSALVRLQERLEEWRARAQSIRDGLAGDRGPVRLPPAGAVCQALVMALRRGQDLGDVGRQANEIDRQIRSLENGFARLLSDLHLRDRAMLLRTRPLLDGEIQQARQSMVEIDEKARSIRDEDSGLANDLEEQHLLKERLGATGEVVTGATLRESRERRDRAWLAVRRAYIDGVGIQEAGLVEAFEASQGEADRQADLLRADAERAAALAVCAGRIEQMSARRVLLKQAVADLDERRGEVNRAWKEALQKGALPDLDPESLKQWQVRRDEAMQMAARLTLARTDHERLLNEAADACEEIVRRLRALGEPDIDGANGNAAVRLATAIDHALAWEGQSNKADAEREARAKAERDQRLELTRLDASSAKADEESLAHRAALDAWCSRILLDRHALPDAIRARLDELADFARKAVGLAEARLRQRHYAAEVDDLERQARGLCELIGEPAPVLIEDLADRLRKRLAIARERDRERGNLRRDLAQAVERRRRAEAERVQHMAILDRLCRSAGGIPVDALPAAEEKAGRKDDLAKRYAELLRQLSEASSSNEDVLRERLAGQDATSMEIERERIGADIKRREAELAEVRQAEEHARRALEAIDTSDAAAVARETMEAGSARLRAAIRPWARLRLAHALLREALNRFRERAQAPMIAAASTYFSLMTDGAFTRLVADDTTDQPVLRAERASGAIIGVEAMSEGTVDQLYLALRLAALELRRASHPHMPLVLDDVLITSDDARAANILRALERFAAASQVVLFTHHRHLIDVARAALPERACAVHML